MKTLVIITVYLLFVTINLKAQKDSTKFIQEIQGGMVVGTSASTTFSNIEHPFDIGYCLLGNVVFITPKTYHNFMYSMGNNSFSIINGYFLPKNWDTYLVYSKSLTLNQNYLGIGFEKMVKAGDVGCFLFFEVGTDFKGNETLSVGVLICVQSVFWKRK